MKNPLVGTLACLMAAVPLAAQVTLTFDTDTESFSAGYEAGAAVSHSPFEGGTLAITAPGGYRPGSARIDLAGGAPQALRDEFQLALANGGTLSYRLIIATDSVPAGETPGWFEPMIVANSQGIFDVTFQAAEGQPVLYGAFPLSSQLEYNITHTIEAAPVGADDPILQFNPTSGYLELILGLNSQGGSPPALSAAVLYIDDFTIDANESPVSTIPVVSLEPANAGLNLVMNGGGQYDRCTVRTLAPPSSRSWVGNATLSNPVTYSFNVVDFPDAQGMNAFLYLVPGSSVGTNYSDFSEPNVAVLRLGWNNENNSSMSFAYKLGAANSNGPPGNSLFDNDTVPSSGLGGILANVGAAKTEGTWSITFVSDTEFTLTAPDASTASGELDASTAAAFAGDLTVYLGVVPGQMFNIGRSAVFGSLSVTGIPAAFTDDFTDGNLGADLVPDGGAAILAGPTNEWWVRWTVPATGYNLEYNSDLGATWTPHAGPIVNIPGFRRALIDATTLADPDLGFFRLNRP